MSQVYSHWSRCLTLNSNYLLCPYPDVDECEEEIDGCGQICNNTEGSFFCSCMMGYSLADDQFNCSGKDVKSEGICAAVDQ